MLIWRRLEEPAVLTLAQILTYAVAVAAGSLLVGLVPPMLSGVIGAEITASVGGLLAAGGVVGALSCYWGVWWLERIALYLVGLGWVLLSPAVIGSSLLSLHGKWLVILLLVLAVFDTFKRYRRIDWAYLDPAK